MTPEEMAALHAAAFTQERPWSAAEFRDLLAAQYTCLHARPHGFALSRTIAGESELLTLAVDPTRQRQGIGRALIGDWLTAIGPAQAFLEVAADNHAALALYENAGFIRSGLRPAYYMRKAGSLAADAVMMTRG